MSGGDFALNIPVTKSNSFFLKSTHKTNTPKYREKQMHRNTDKHTEFNSYT